MSKGERKKELQREWWARNSDVENKKRYEKRKVRAAWFRDLKKKISCSRCSESHPACIDFHHVDTTTKRIEVSNMLTGGWSKSTITAEMNKCIPLCVNCHRKEHKKCDNDGS